MPVIKKWLAVTILLLILVFLPASPSWGNPGSVFVGVEQGELFSGSKFALDQKYDLMVSLYEQSGLGLGLYYHDDSTKLDLVNEPRLQQGNLFTPNFSIAVLNDKTLAQKTDSFSIQGGPFVADGFYSSNPLDTESGISMDYKLPQMETKVIYSQDQIDSLLNDFEFKQKVTLANNIFEADYQNNQYLYNDNKLIGQGSEFFWTPPFNYLRLGVGHFHEDLNNITADRDRIRLEYYTNPVANADNWKFGGSAEEFLYSQGDQRLELTALGQYRKSWDTGAYYQFSCQDIQSAGDTPFLFDNDPANTCEGAAEFNWHYGVSNTNLALSYDMTAGNWEKAKGYTEFPIFKNFTGLWVAQYQLNQPFYPEQTTYLLELKYSDSFNLMGRMEWNEYFSPLEISTKASFPSNQDLLELEASFSFYYHCFDVIRLSYSIPQIGKLSLNCEFERGSFMLTYSWL
jgi:hypothetical protein